MTYIYICRATDHTVRFPGLLPPQCLKYGGITAHLGSDKLVVGSDETKMSRIKFLLTAAERLSVVAHLCLFVLLYTGSALSLNQNSRCSEYPPRPPEFIGM